MKTTTCGTNGAVAEGAKATIRSRVKMLAVALLLSGTVFTVTGCYDDPHYYGRRGVRAGYYASYGGPGPYYGYDPYPYGYGYGSGIGIGVSSYRSHPGYYRRPYYRRGYYGRSGYNRRYDRGRNWERRGDRDRRGDRRSWERRARGERGRALRRSTAPAQQQDAGRPADTQPE